MMSVRKYIVIADESGRDAATALLERIRKEGICCELLEIETELDANQIAHLSTQTMGTRIAMVATHHHIHATRTILEFIGYGPEETEEIHMETDTVRVFCAHCHHVFDTPLTEIVQCSLCSYTLSVTNHYAERFDAMLGSIFWPPGQSDEEGKPV